MLCLATQCAHQELVVSNHWRRSYADNDLNWNECKYDLLKYYSENQVYAHHMGFVVDSRYLVSPHKKWRSIGNHKWYFYKNIDELVTRYFKREKNEDNKQL